MHRVAVFGLMYETNSFAAGRVDVEHFRDRVLLDGHAGLAVGGDRHQLAGLGHVAAQRGIELVPLVFAIGTAGPVVASETHRELRDRILGALTNVAAEIDGVAAVLHGAMVSESSDDVEGELLADVRRIVGPATPVAASFDLHAHITDLVTEHADIIAGYRTFPHVDRRETGERQMRLLADALDGLARPVVCHRKLRMVAPAEHQRTSVPGPASEVIGRLHEIEREHGVLDASVFLTQPWLDVEEFGWSVVVMADDDGVLGQHRADELGAMLWDRRARFLVDKTPIDEALASVRSSSQTTGPFVVADGADAPSAGTTGDGAVLLAALLASPSTEGLGPAAVVVTDPAAVASCHAAGVGTEVSLSVGATICPAFFEPVDLVGTVTTLASGRYQSVQPPIPVDVGRVAVVRRGDVDVVLTERPANQSDDRLYRRVGIDPAELKLVQVKSAVAYHAHYDSIAAGTFDLDTTGPGDSDLTRLPFTRPRRPLWPFDSDLSSPWDDDQRQLQGSTDAGNVPH